MLAYRPALYLDELQAYIAHHFGIHVSLATISNGLTHRGWKKKALRLVAKQRNPTLRAAYLFEISTIPPECLVFVDESGVDRRDGSRRTGWAPKAGVLQGKVCYSGKFGSSCCTR